MNRAKQIVTLAVLSALCATPAFADRAVWRVQVDPYGETDPTFQVFLGDIATDPVTGVATVRHDVEFPVTIKRSELKSINDLFDAKAMSARQIAARKKVIEDTKKALQQ